MTTATATSKRPSTLPTEIRFSGGEGSLLVVAAAAADGDGPKKDARRLEMVAYSGGPMLIGAYPMYADLDGMEIAADQVMPLLRQHDGNRIAGQTTEIAKTPKGLTIKATLFDTEAGREVRSLADQGFRWQASIGFRVEPSKYQWLDDEDQKASVNGRDVKGPCVIARKSTLKEASAVPLGADAATSAVVTASIDAKNLNPQRSTKIMTEPIKATLAELKAAFPKHREFSLDMAEKGLTLAEAKAEFADVLTAEIATKDEELVKAKAAAAHPAPAPAPKPSVRQPVGVGSPASASGPISTAAQINLDLPENAGPATVCYHDHVAAFKAQKNLSLAEARREVARKFPKVHAAFITEMNAGAEWQQFPMQTASGFVRR